MYLERLEITLIKIEYKGKLYNSLINFCKENNYSYQKIRKCLNDGLSINEAVEKIEHKKYEYNGKFYSSRKELAKELGVSPRVFEQSKKYKNLKNSISPSKKIFIFRGVEYENKDAFYKALGITDSGVRKYAIRNNITTKEAIEQLANKRLGDKNNI